MKKYLLDTDASSCVIKGTSPNLDAHLSRLRLDQGFISSVTRAELLFGVRRLTRAHPRATRLSKAVNEFLATVPTLPWDSDAADAFADLRTALDSGGTPIGVMDTMIAAHAMAALATLVTNNVRHFRRVSGLTVENWVAS